MHTDHFCVADCLFNRATLDMKNHKPTTSYQNFSIFQDIFIIQLHKNIVKPRIRTHGNIDKIFGNNADNIFQIQNSRNFKVDFFLNL